MPNEAGQLTLDIPQREGKEGFVGMFFGLYLKTGGILADANFRDTDTRIEYMVHFLISLIPTEKRRIKIRSELLNEIKEATKGIASNEDKARLRNMVCIENIGKVTDYIDEHVGISRENKIGTS